MNIMDLKKAREVVLSLDPDGFMEFIKDVHFDYPLRTKKLTDELVYGLKSHHSMKSEEFDGLIEERKEEHGREIRETRVGGRRRIQDMKSKTGLDPLEIFPKEIWIRLLKQLLPEDKLNVLKVHDLYRILTEDTLFSDILLPLTLSFLVNQSLGVQQGHGRYLIGIEKRNLLEFLGTLRLVSKSLRNAVDRWYEDDLISVLRNENMLSRPAGVIGVDLLAKSDYQKFKDMESDMKDSSAVKPQRFFIRSLEFILDEDMENEEEYDGGWENKKEQLEEYNRNINAVLDYIGEQILYFQFIYFCPSEHATSNSKPTFADRFTSLQGWLAKMPNLKWFKLTIDRKTEGDFEFRHYFRLPRESSLPPLKYLERMDLNMRSPNRHAYPVFNKFLSSYPHVKILNLYGIRSAMESGVVLLNSLRNSFSLECLSCVDGPPLPKRHPLWMIMTGNSVDDDGRNTEDISRDTIPPSIFALNWPLRRLELEMNMRGHSVYCLFRSLGDVPTLERVSLVVKNSPIKDDVSYVELPNLTHFDFRFEKEKCEPSEGNINWSFFFSLQYLLHVKKLNSLEWKCEMAEDTWEKAKHDVAFVEEEGRGKILDFGDVIWDLSLKNSNIWRVFPWLDSVKTARVVRGGDGERLMRVVKEYCRNEIKPEVE